MRIDARKIGLALLFWVAMLSIAGGIVLFTVAYQNFAEDAFPYVFLAGLGMLCYHLADYPGWWRNDGEN